MKRLPFFATALLSAWLTTASLHAAQLIQGPSAASVDVCDYTSSNYDNKYSNDMDDQDLLDLNMADDLDTIALKAKSELPLGAVVLGYQPFRKSKNNNNDDQKEGHLAQTPQKPNATYQRYIFAASGLVDTKAHNITHRLGYHLVQTTASHIVPVLLQWLSKSQGKHIHRLAFTAPLCPKCHYLLTLVYTQGNMASNDKGCAQQPLIWPLPSLAMRYLNNKIVQLGKPLEITQTILDKVLGISQKRFTQLQKDNNNLIKTLQNENSILKNNNKQTNYLIKTLQLKSLKTLQGHDNYVLSVAFSPNSKRLASASSDNTVRIYHATSYQLVKTLKGHTNSVTSVAFSPDSKRLASASRDKTVRIYDATSYKLLKTLQGHTSDVKSVAFSPDSKRLASASYDKTVRIYDTTSYRHLKTLQVNLKTWSLVTLVDGNVINSVAFSPDKKRLASASSDQTVRIYDAKSYKHLKTLQIDSSIWNLQTLVNGNVVWSVAFSPNSKRLASASSDKTVRIYDATTYKHLKTLQGHTGIVYSVAFSPDSQRLASASYDKTVRIYDATSYKLLTTLQGHTHYVNSVAFSPDGQRLASASFDKTVCIYDATSYELLATLKGHKSEVWSIAFSPNSKRLASSSRHDVRIHDTTSYELLTTLQGHRWSINSVAFSPDSKRLASASCDNTVRIYDATSYELLTTLQGHTDWVHSVAFSPDKKRLASASTDNTVRIWG